MWARGPWLFGSFYLLLERVQVSMDHGKRINTSYRPFYTIIVPPYLPPSSYLEVWAKARRRAVSCEVWVRSDPDLIGYGPSACRCPASIASDGEK